MQAFHNLVTRKNFFLKRVSLHQAAGRIRQGCGYWDGTCGCAVGATLENGEGLRGRCLPYDEVGTADDYGLHYFYEMRLRVPRFLAHLEDDLFDVLPEERASTWAYDFLEAIPVGADLRPFPALFCTTVLQDPLLWLGIFEQSRMRQEFVELLASTHPEELAKSQELLQLVLRHTRSGPYPEDESEFPRDRMFLQALWDMLRFPTFAPMVLCDLKVNEGQPLSEEQVTVSCHLADLTLKLLKTFSQPVLQPV